MNEGTGSVPSYASISVTDGEFNKFEDLARKIVSVPKAEIAKAQKKKATSKRR
jgi:hypothetical protein